MWQYENNIQRRDLQRYLSKRKFRLLEVQVSLKSRKDRNRTFIKFLYISSSVGDTVAINQEEDGIIKTAVRVGCMPGLESHCLNSKTLSIFGAKMRVHSVRGNCFATWSIHERRLSQSCCAKNRSPAHERQPCHPNDTVHLW